MLPKRKRASVASQHAHYQGTAEEFSTKAAIVGGIAPIYAQVSIIAEQVLSHSMALRWEVRPGRGAAGHGRRRLGDEFAPDDVPWLSGMSYLATTPLGVLLLEDHSEICV